MKIFCKFGNSGTKDIPPNQLINKVGKYLKKSIDGAYSYSTGVNVCFVKLIAYYQIPKFPDKPGGEITYSDMKEMVFEIGLTTYSNKVRVNIIELDPKEQTIGHFVVEPKKLYDMVEARKLILDKINKILNKYFEGYIFIF